ncbi:MAG: PQQ-binding-like beta-propeller repeat protein, partial [Gemmataceae bacterium]
MIRCPGALLLVCCLTATTSAGNWPGWRGPTGQGTSPDKNLPVKWSPSENVRWKVALPDSGNSTPIIWGDRVFVTQASDKTWPVKPADGMKIVGNANYTPRYGAAGRRSVLCFNRADGKLLWQRDVVYKEKEPTHPDNPYCSESPVTDGERVIASHGPAGVVCYDFDGKEVWKRDVGKLEHIWGTASSPILHGDLCIIWRGPGVVQSLIALNKKTGETVWEHKEPEGKAGLKDKTVEGAWSTPLMARVGDQDQLIAVTTELEGFDPQTGKSLWTARRAGLCYHSPLFKDEIVYLGDSAYKLGGTGDIAKSRLPLRMVSGSYVHTGVIGGDYLYSHSTVPRCYELSTGKELWGDQMKERPRLQGVWGALVHADGKVYYCDQGGTTIVLKAGPQYELLGMNSLKEHVNSSIAVADGEIYIRTYKHLWCISAK